MENVRLSFLNSPKEFRPVPWWSWTGDMSQERIDREILMMREQGIYEFIIFAISGLAVEFNSDAYFDKVKHALERCREWEMRAWIYDDYNWPAGTCAGKVLRDHPWTQAKVLNYEICKVEPSTAVEIPVPGEFVGAFFAGPGKRVIPLAGEPTFATDGMPVLQWRNDTGDAGRILAFSFDRLSFVMPFGAGSAWTWNQPGVLDGMNFDAVEMFIKYSYEPYAERFSAYLGREIKGFFTDEPGIWGLRRYGLNTLPYTRDLWRLFLERHGYRLEERLPELLIEVEDWQRTRFDYWSLISDLFAENWLRQVSDWCLGHGVELTGHFMGEETVRWNMRFNGDVHRVARLMTTPGIDLLGPLTSYDVDAPGRQAQVLYNSLRSLNITAKRVSSTADYSGARRRLAESLGLGGSDQSLAPMRKVVDWLAAMGFNLINDAWRSFRTPWFPYYGQFSEHAGRVCWMTTVGQSVEEVGVLYPTTSGWTLYGAMLEGSVEERVWPTIETALLETCDALNRIHRGYKLLFDEELAEARVDQERLAVGSFPFTTVILPTVVAVQKAVCDKLTQYANAGGKILIVGPGPFLTPDQDWDVTSAMEALIRNDNVDQLNEPIWGAAYESWLSERIEKPAVYVDGPGARQVLSAYRRDSVRDYLFISNQTVQPAQVRVSSELAGVWELWDPDSGRQWQLETQNQDGARSRKWELAPYESAFVVVNRDSEIMPSARRSAPFLQDEIKRMNLIGPWQFETVDLNMVVPDLSIQTDPIGEGIGKEGWEYGREGTWTPTTGGRTEIALDPDELACFWLRTEIELGHLPADLEIVVDSRDAGDVFVNGLQVTGGRESAFWDDGNWVYPLREFVFRGRNVLVMCCRPPWYYSKRVRGNFIHPYDIKPVVVRGSFRAFRDRGGCVTLMPETGEIGLGPWEQQGYLDYCGSTVYRRIIRLPEIDERHWLVLEEVRHVAEVEVNGRRVGARLWQPYTFDITETLQKGDNHLAIRVTNNFGRLFPSSSQFEGATHEVLSGLIGRAWVIKTRLGAESGKR